MAVLKLNKIDKFCKILNLNKFYYKLIIKGRYGEVSRYIQKKIQIELKKDFIKFSPIKNEKVFFNLSKVFLSNLKNYIKDSLYGFYIVLEIRGVGYYVKEENKGVLTFYLGYSHKIDYILREGVVFKVLNDKGTLFLLVSSNRSDIFLTLFDFLKMRKKDLYKGKGLFYFAQEVKLKKGKNQKK